MSNWNRNLTSISACIQLAPKWVRAASSLVLETACRSRMHHPKPSLDFCLGMMFYFGLWSSPEGLLLMPVCSLEVTVNKCRYKGGTDFSSAGSCWRCDDKNAPALADLHPLQTCCLVMLVCANTSGSWSLPISFLIQVVVWSACLLASS